MSWSCPRCGRTEPLPPKWCGCEPYPIDAADLAGVVECYIALGPRETRPIDEARFESLIDEHGLSLCDGPPQPPALVRRVTTSGIETAVEQEHQWAPISAALARALE